MAMIIKHWFNEQPFEANQAFCLVSQKDFL
jgi:hypothetical protein